MAPNKGGSAGRHNLSLKLLPQFDRQVAAPLTSTLGATMTIPGDAILLTPRTRLRAPSEADLSYVWSATRVAGFNDGLLWDPPEKFADLDVPLRRALERWSRGIAYQWTIENRTSREFLGRTAVSQTDNLDEWMLGFWIHPEHQRHGYATEAAKAVVTFAFEQLNARAIVAAHATWNVASGKVLAALGMKKVRTNPKGFKKADRWVEEYEYELYSKRRANPILSLMLPAVPRFRVLMDTGV